MDKKMFNNLIFDQWLTKKTEEILSKVDREQITTEEMIVLSLKAQANHFHHMDIEFRDEFKKVDQKFIEIKSEMKDKFNKIDQRFIELKAEMKDGFNKIDQRFIDTKIETENNFKKNDTIFLRIDKCFDRLETMAMWGFGVMLTGFSGIFFQLLKH